MNIQPKTWLFVFGLFSFLIVGCFPGVEKFSDDESYYSDDNETIIVIEAEPIYIQPIIIIDEPAQEPIIKHRNPPAQRADISQVTERPSSYSQSSRVSSNRNNKADVKIDNSRKRGER